MPATEQTWRGVKLMHVIFGVSAIAMLVTTVAMLAFDHYREWKPVQRKFRDIESWYGKARISEQDTDAFRQQERALEEELAKQQAQVPPQELIDRFLAEARSLVPSQVDSRARHDEANGYDLAKVEEAFKRLQDADASGATDEEKIALRAELDKAIQAVVTKAQFVEENDSRALKFEKANLSVDVSMFNLAVGADTDDQLDVLQGKVDAVKAKVDALTEAYQDANTHRLALQAIQSEVNAEVAVAQKALDDQRTKLTTLVKSLDERELTLRKEILDLPILTAFNSPLKIDNLWLPKLTFNNNFRDVARFDRCTTCHQGMEKSAPGSATEPGYPLVGHASTVLLLATPAQAPEFVDAEGNRKTPQALLNELYGLQLAGEGLIDVNDVTISVVRAEQPGAKAKDEAGHVVGLAVGDVIEEINDVKLLDLDMAHRYLVSETVEWGKPLRLTVRRGLPNPYATHPRLDLYLGSTSPHKLNDFGCTICHEGQGSGTAFKWASHTPNTPREMDEWKEKYGWFNNHHWIYPMRPERFKESGCLKCHHEMTELEPSERFPDPPAPKLMAGYNVIREFGCFGCHEIHGYDGPNKRRGPDIRVEPNYAAAAAQVLIDPKLGERERQLAIEVVSHPDRTSARMLLAELINADGAKPATADGEEPAAEAAKALTADTHRMATILGADDETPGTYRKVGPSLRFVKSKVGEEFLHSWLKDPTNFRPSTKMPKFFGLWNHLKEPKEDAEGHYVVKPKLDAQGQPVLDAAGHEVMEPENVPNKGLTDAERFEPIEIRAITHYLLASSQPFEYADPPSEVTEQPSAERGKQVFQTRGCLACHEHKDFAEAKSNLSDQGPNLSRIGDKLTQPDGQRWLYSWVREPSRYHARTKMPVTFLNPTAQPDGKVTDPAADVTAFLLASQEDWKPEAIPELDEKNLDDLARIFLSATFTKRQTEKFLKEGIPEEMRATLKGDEALLVGAPSSDKKLMYVGRRTIGRLGCSACHDIPGFEDAKPIGTGLADWGRKEPSKLAFEQVVQYLVQQANVANAEHRGDGQLEHHGLDPHAMPGDKGYFVEALMHHEREGFIWQKLREPRSFDYETTENKEYTDRLRMPKFNFSDEQVEAVITFVLGLVAEPPAAQYIYKPDPRRSAVLEGERVLTKFNCAGCHTLKMETWNFDFDPKTFPEPPEFADFAFLNPHFTPQEIADSKKVNRAGLGHASVTGMPNPEVQEDDDGNPLHYFQQWKSVLINGRPWVVGDQEVPVAEAGLRDKRAPVGGDFARYLHPIALSLEQATNPNAKASDAWGWVPPPLVGEGDKVQTQWLHDFLLNPEPIRPAVILRMPKFNMSPDEAAKLVDYFAAVDDAVFPYPADRRRDPNYLAPLEAQHPHRFDDALKLITSNDYCIKCHKLGDFTPAGSVAALAPNLDRVYERLRGDFVHRWIANPKRLLPYTGMPVNFPPPPAPPASQNLFAGSSEEQIQAITDFLMNYDNFMKNQKSYKDTIKPAPPAAAAAGN